MTRMLARGSESPTGDWLRDPLTRVALATGLLLPLVSAVLYPTYDFEMSPAWVELSRLIEFPFIVAEFAVVVAAQRSGWSMGSSFGSLPRDIRVALFLLLPAMFGSSLLVSPAPAASAIMAVGYLMHILFAGAVAFWIKQGKGIAVETLPICLIAGLAALAVATAAKFCLPPPPWLHPQEIAWQAALPGFISIRHFGSWTGAIASLFAAWLLSDKRDAAMDWRHAAYLLAISMTIWSGTRAAILALGCSLALLLLFAGLRPGWRSFGRIAMLSGLGACVAYVLLPPGETAFLLWQYQDFGGANQVSSGRLEMWRDALEQAALAPIWGWGTGSIFWLQEFGGWRHTQPHNVVIQYLYSWGMAGTLPALWILTRATIGAYWRVRAGTAPIMMLGALNSLIVMSLLEGMLHYPRFIMLVAFLFAILLESRREPASG